MAQTISGEPLGSPGDTGDPTLAPYRRWALQSNVLSLLDGDASWGSARGHDGADRVEETLTSGNAALLEQLEPDPEIRRRVRAMALLWIAALLLETVNQLTPIGIKDSTRGYVVIEGMVLLALAITLLVFPRLTFKQFVVYGGVALVYAYVLIAIKVAGTGGMASPYAPLWVFVTLYCAYFLPRQRAVPHFVVIAVALASPFVYDTDAGVEAAIYLGVLVAACAVLAFFVLSGRELTRGADRAVRYLALADPLTGLANLRSFEAAVENAVRSGERRFAIVLVELEGLKGANLVFGQEAGDDMLRRLAGMLCAACGERDQAARLRGDEFAVLLPGAGEREIDEWRERFDEFAARHNDWARGRLPRIAVEAGAAVYPEDGARLSQLTETADRRLLAAKAAVVRPPYEVDAGAVTDTGQLLRTDLAFEDPRRRQIRRAPRQSAVFWLVAGLALVAYLLPPELIGRDEVAVRAIAGVCLMLAIGGFAVRRPRARAVYLRVSDVATLAVIAPITWSAGGWQSPLQAAMIFPVTFYAQFLSGRQALARVAIAVTLYSAAFWTSDLVGVADGAPSAAARTLYLALLTTLTVITAILQRNRRETDASLELILGSAEHDAVTGVFNVHAFRRHLHSMVDRARRSASTARHESAGVEFAVERPVLMIVDVDDLRGVNLRAGHLVGDSVLKAIAERLRRMMAGTGNVYRVDAGKFALLFAAESDEVVARVEREIRVAVSSADGSGGALPEPVRVSVGVSRWRDRRTAFDMVDEAGSCAAAEQSLRSARTGFGDGPTLL